MPVLTPAQLQKFSDLAMRLAGDKTCEIQDEVLTPIVGGGSDFDGYTTINTAPCIVVVNGAPNERPVAGAVATETKREVFFPFGTVLLDRYRLVIDGRKYHIIGLNTGASFEVLPSAEVREEFSA